MSQAKVEITAGQRWAIRDDRYGGWRYVTVLAADEHFVEVKGRRRSRIRAHRFGGARFTFCGHDGSGILPPYTALPGVMLGCAYSNYPTILPLEYGLNPGFGYVSVTRDGTPVWSATDTSKRLAHMELRARETPGDWRLRIESPLAERLYQRQEQGWVLVAIGMGFA